MSVAVEASVEKPEAESEANADTAASDESESRSAVAASSSGVRAPLHHLQNSWTLWFYKSDNSRKWEDNLRDVTKLLTVEEFWGLYNHIVPPASLQQGCDYCLFKTGIRPMWEDTRNQHGGRWVISLDKREREAHLNAYWLELLLLLVGEACEDELADVMCGAVVNVRSKGDKISLWISIGYGKPLSDTHKDQIMKIGRLVRERLQLPDGAAISFEAHQNNAVLFTLK